MMFNSILCRYHEIATKGNNRIMFERCLVDNIHCLFKKAGFDYPVRRVRGRIWIEKKDGTLFDAEEVQNISRVLERTFGIESFSPAIRLEADMDVLEAKVKELAPIVFEEYFAKFNTVSFRVRARRSNKQFPLCSKDIEIRLADALTSVVDDSRLTVDLDNAQVTFGCEVRDEFALLFMNECKGPGGLPVGSNEGAVALFSGGIDSPVACYMTMKRGCPVDFVAFHSNPYTPQETTDKIKRIADHMNLFQRGGKLFLCNLVEFQKLVRDYCTPKYRTILYRRGMLRIAEKIADKYHRIALLTGDSVGQVASQTLQNMRTIDAATPMLVLRPLVGMDKMETIRIAEKIGTFALSNVQVPDSCTVFSPSQAATTSDIATIEEEESRIPDYDAVLTAIADGAERV